MLTLFLNENRTAGVSLSFWAVGTNRRSNKACKNVNVDGEGV